MTLHRFLDSNYGTDGATVLKQLLDDGADPNSTAVGVQRFSGVFE